MGSVVFLGSALPAAAQQPGELTPKQQKHSDTLVKEAVEHYGARRYEEAVKLFKQAYEIEQEPELLYNIARSYERLSRHKEAVEWYQRFLDVPGTTSELRTRARANIEMLRQEMNAVKKTRKNRDDGAAEPSSGGVASSEENTDTKIESGSKKNTSARRKDSSVGPQNEGSPNPFRIVGWSAAGVGAAAIVTGSVFGGLALKSKKDYEAADYNEDRIDYRDDMKRNSLIFDIVFFTGTGLAATGIALLVVDAVRKHAKTKETDDTTQPKGKAARQRPSVTFSPSFAVGNESLTGGLAGHF